MFGSGNFWDKSPLWFFQIFKDALGQFISNRPPKHVITKQKKQLFPAAKQYENFSEDLTILGMF